MIPHPPPGHTVSTTERRLLFTICAVIIAGIDIFSAGLGLYAFDINSFLLYFGLCTLFALAGFFRVCEFLFIAGYVTANACDLVDTFAMLGFGVPVVLVMWILRSWIIPAIAAMIIEAAVAVTLGPTPRLQILSSIIITVLTLAVGLSLRWQNNRRIFAEAKREEAFEAVRQTRQELARQLHDTTAKDLAHVAILAQDLAIRHPDLSDELGTLVEIATSASRRIRPIIISMDTTATETPLSKVVTQVSNMLSTRDITLEVNTTGDIDTLTTRQQRRTAPDLLALSLSNLIAAQPPISHMSSGYGLANLANRIRTEGGTMQSSAVDQQWITYITLPAHTSVTSESPSMKTETPKE